MNPIREKIIVGERRARYVERQLSGRKPMTAISRGFAMLELEYHRAALMALRYHEGVLSGGQVQERVDLEHLTAELERQPYHLPEIDGARAIIELDAEQEERKK
jgi:hypothetical protein